MDWKKWIWRGSYILAIIIAIGPFKRLLNEHDSIDWSAMRETHGYGREVIFLLFVIALLSAYSGSKITGGRWSARDNSIFTILLTLMSCAGVLLAAWFYAKCTNDLLSIVE